MKYVITGGAGFIGSHLAEDLIDSGEQVIVIDNLSTGSLSNLSGISSNDKFRLIISDVRSVRHWEDILDGNTIIIHLAATVGVNKVVCNSLETLENNFQPTLTLLNQALPLGCKIFLASTSEVYGESTGVCSSESDPLIVPSSHCGRSAYTLGKLTSEHYCLNYSRQFGLPVIVARFFNAIGLNQIGNYGMVVPTFVRQALAGEPITVYGTGNQTRSFCNVKDIVRAIRQLLQTDSAYGQVFNVGGSESITITELATYIKRVTGSSSPIVYKPFPPHRSLGKDILHRKARLDKICSVAGWKPLTSWHTVIDEIIDHQKVLLQSRPREQYAYV
ncbi:MAG: GDP-mannose 4,6-dehydratase [Bacteroidota bacterium]|nr:GDP-mannose 4,6-dehydratase [Bacteroidota bacterium]MDP4245948.1 GDP-mannose 4,6-dehydratase [Bacteroidota bacterium]MDP4256276.1 GDP-mannose 4,6-dehydratase [Bacteroidota bacterium]MDP4260254.1 GDP-mannose 4,6-dehydratase [Bacteroidota bacterium]